MGALPKLKQALLGKCCSRRIKEAKRDSIVSTVTGTPKNYPHILEKQQDASPQHLDSLYLLKIPADKCHAYEIKNHIVRGPASFDEGPMGTVVTRMLQQSLRTIGKLVR